MIWYVLAFIAVWYGSGFVFMWYVRDDPKFKFRLNLNSFIFLTLFPPFAIMFLWINRSFWKDE